MECSHNHYLDTQLAQNPRLHIDLTHRIFCGSFNSLMIAVDLFRHMIFWCQGYKHLNYVFILDNDQIHRGHILDFSI